MTEIKLKNRTIDEYGQVGYTDNGLFELLYEGKDISDLCALSSPQITEYNKQRELYDEPVISLLKKLDVPVSEYDKLLQETWLFPEEYQKINLLPILLDKCKTESERERVMFEWKKYEAANWIIILQLLHWLVSVMRKNKVVWGVGRGSSVASFILYLLGVHKINPLKYDLNFNEFMRLPQE